PRLLRGSPALRARRLGRPLDQLEPVAPVVLDGEQPVEVAPALERLAQADRHLRAGEAVEVGGLLQRAVEPRRRDLEPRIVDVLDLEHVRQLPADLLAIVERDARRRIDEHAQHALLPAFDDDHLVAHGGQGAFDDRLRGRRLAHCHPLPTRGRPDEKKKWACESPFLRARRPCFTFRTRPVTSAGSPRNAPHLHFTGGDSPADDYSVKRRRSSASGSPALATTRAAAACTAAAPPAASLRLRPAGRLRRAGAARTAPAAASALGATRRAAPIPAEAF